ncbi:MAG: translocation/assembly module TamB domain-containing protein [Gammaproteobacteria bacterium]|nr:translocation/assembly module TamB domain-containing protein [Gammaproteobacteria bacterium]
MCILHPGPDLATVTGEVSIPQADIHLERLPETAVSVSPDTVIVGAEAPAAGFDYALDLRLHLGDQVQFRGLGADARLGGSIELRKQPGDASRDAARSASSMAATAPTDRPWRSPRVASSSATR